MAATTKPTFAKVAAKAVDAPRIIARPTGSDVVLKTPTDASSDSSVKQSVASGTTFALDEKESLRPDDSASLRAIEDEEQSALGSRAGSDTGTEARAFSAQLNRIQQMAVTPRARPNLHFGSIQLNPPTEPQTPVSSEPNPVAVAPDMPEVDEKLIEGLKSPRDRVWILKIEQDILDFMKNDRDQHLTLPDCNSFYRMLSHRLAEYYGLEHTHHPRNSGTAVLISKTPQSRVPPPLAALPMPELRPEPPPPATAARKIMRRGENGASGPSTSVNSEGPSKAASEAGDGASDIGKSKGTRTREQREKDYEEARRRIFGSEEAKSDDKKKSADEDASRSSSTSGGGKKKASRRRNNDDDDDFQPRSQFPGYHHYDANGYSDGSFYFPQMMTSPVSQSTSPPSMLYQHGYTQADGTAPMQYLVGQPFSPSTGSYPQQYPQSPDMAFDMTTQFAAMTFNGSAPNMKGGKAAGSSAFNASGQMQIAQPRATYDSSQYAYGQPSTLPQYGDRPMATAHQAQMIAPFYGQPTNGTYQNGKGQHPPPGSYNRNLSFNPQTQAFVPGGRSGPMPVAQNSSGYFNPFAAGPNTSQYRQASGPSPALQQRGTPPHQAYSGHNSPAIQTFKPNHGAAGQQTQQYAASSAGHGAQRPAPAHTASSEGSRQPHPLPQLPNPESSIAKWGTPAHLPPKPPTPNDMHPRKYLDINKGLPVRLPGLPGYPSAPS